MSLIKRKQPDLERYRQLRAAGKRLISKMYDVAKGPEFDIGKAAKKLTIRVVERTLVFDGETDTAALADFYLNEMRFGGKRILDVLAESGTALTADERELLAAHRNARSSLSATIGADPVACQIQLRDLLEPSAPDVTLTDIGLSQSAAAAPGVLLFTRVLSCEDCDMAAGLFFGFPAAQRIHLLNAYAARMATVAEKEWSQRTYVFFYQKHREFGLEQAYQNVV
jgi:hypothetical protein